MADSYAEWLQLQLQPFCVTVCQCCKPLTCSWPSGYAGQLCRQRGPCRAAVQAAHAMNEYLSAWWCQLQHVRLVGARYTPLCSSAAAAMFPDAYELRPLNRGPWLWAATVGLWRLQWQKWCLPYTIKPGACRLLPGAALSWRWYITVPVSSISKLQGQFGPQYCL